MIFNIFDIAFFLYFYFIFWNILSSSKFKKWTKYGAILFIISSIINPFFHDFVLYPQLLATSVGSMILIGCILLYFKELRTNAYTPNVHNLLFWISIGLLIFYSLYPFILLVGYFNYELYQKFHMHQIHHVLIAAMYSCFIIGFLLMQRMRP